MTSPPRGRPRAEPRAEQRERIVRAARAAFTERGYDAVSLSGVAREAGVARTTVYDVVGSKEHLLGAVADRVADEIIAAVDDRFPHPEEDTRPLDEVILDNIRGIFELIGSEPSYTAIIRLSGRLASDGEDVVSRARHRIEDRITELHANRARNFGVERAATARVLSVALLAMLETVVIRTGEDGWDAGAVADLVGEFAVGGYLRTELGGMAEAFEAPATKGTGPRS